MAKLTYQGLIRTFCGRSKSAMDLRNKLPVTLLPQNLAGPIQIVMTNPADDAHEVGMLPANFAIERVQVITPADAGTYSLDIPEYAGEATESLVAGADATGAVATTLAAARELVPFDRDVPLVVTTAGVTGTLRIGIFGFPFDDATQVF